MGVDSVSIEVSLLLAELSHRADRWGNLNREIHKYTNIQIYRKKKQLNWPYKMCAEKPLTIEHMPKSQ